MTDNDLSLKLERARWWMLNHQPFYGQLTMNLADQFGQIPTACVDGKKITWSRDFLAKLTDQETRYVLLHETLHCAHAHLWRLPTDELGNIAGDYAIELIMRAIPDITQPQNGLICPIEFEKSAEEEVYTALKHKQQEQQKSQSSEDGSDSQDGSEDGSDSQDGSEDGSEKPNDSCGAFSTPAKDANQDSRALEDQWQNAIVQAAQVVALSHGTVPSDGKRLIARIRTQPIDWRQEIADFLKNQSCERNDWSRSHRRHAWQSVIYPRKQPDIMTFVIAIDTSGSIDETLLAEFVSLAEILQQEIGCEVIRIDCDTCIHAETRMLPGQDWSLETHGGGGTDFAPVFERVKCMIEDSESIGGIIYFTDLQGEHAKTWDESIPTIWAATKGPQSYYPVPFGRIVDLSNRH